MPFCYAPWTNIDISPQGEISPCCKFQMSAHDSKFNVQTHSLTEYFDSDFLSSVKEAMEQHHWPKGCERCKIEEQHSIPSKRLLDRERWSQQYQDWDKNSNGCITASVAFGNTCNLKCITCSSYSSSKWHKESMAIAGVAHSTVKFYQKDFVDQLVTHAPKLIHLDIPGGEPLLSGVPDQHRLLQHYIDSGQAQNMTLHYTTNATVFPDPQWWQLWQHFAKVEIQLSIDGLDKHYQYIRFPASWSTLLTVIDQYLAMPKCNVNLAVSHTVSAYNIFYLDEFVSWCSKTGLPEPWLGRVHNPVHMRPTVWPRLTREKIIAKLRNSSWPFMDIVVGNQR
jgi:radical SAM protein with 4Fe4S-binding SPASM domain